MKLHHQEAALLTASEGWNIPYSGYNLHQKVCMLLGGILVHQDDYCCMNTFRLSDE